MARGWESKSVESQMESAKEGQSVSGRELSAEEQNHKREQQTLLLSRAYILQQINSSTNDRYTASLRQALAELDQKLENNGQPKS